MEPNSIRFAANARIKSKSETIDGAIGVSLHFSPEDGMLEPSIGVVTCFNKNNTISS